MRMHKGFKLLIVCVICSSIVAGVVLIIEFF